jgi:hypothetical protein
MIFHCICRVRHGIGVHEPAAIFEEFAGKKSAAGAGQGPDSGCAAVKHAAARIHQRVQRPEGSVFTVVLPIQYEPLAPRPEEGHADRPLADTGAGGG